MLEVRTVKTIDMGDWDSLVSETYGRPYSLQQQDGCKERGNEHLTITPEGAYDYGNDTIPEEVNGDKMGVSFAAWLARDPEKKIPKEKDSYGNDFTPMWWRRNFYPTAEVIAQDLLARGLVEAGEYVIDIDW